MKTNSRFHIWSAIVLTAILPFFGIAQEEELFTLLDAGYTGVTFRNTVTDTKENNILKYSNFYGGAGVGIGDFNNDGLADIFFAGNQVSDRLYINTGNFQFNDDTVPAGIQDNGGWSSGVLIGDINNDGWQDIYVTRELYDENPELRRNKLYINITKFNKENKTTFKESAVDFGLADEQRTRHAAFLDYNKDGFMDIFLLNQPPNPGNLSNLFGTDLKHGSFSSRLYKNNGNQTFSDVTDSAGLLRPGFANSISIFDANNDGWPDIYVTNDFEAPDFFYLNNKNGTFSQIVDKAMGHISYFSMGVDTGDINNDGNLDLMVLDMVAENNFRLKSNMSGMDTNSFWQIHENGGHYQYMFNTLQLNQGNFSGTPLFSDVAQMAGVSSTDWSWSNVIADFDNDGFKDIYITNGLLRDIRNTDSDRAVSNYIVQVADEFVKNNPNAGDVSIWNILDLEKTLSLIPSEKLSNYAFKNLNGHNFKKISDDWGLEQLSFSSGCAYADLDNDGDLDLVVNNVNDLAFVYENNGNRSEENNYLRIALTDKNEHKPILGSRVEIVQGMNRQMYEFTSVRGMYSTSEQIAHFGLPKNQNIDTLKITWPNSQVNILTDVNANQKLELDIDSFSNSQADQLIHTKNKFQAANNIQFEHRENKFDDFQKQILLPHKLSQFGPSLAVGDVNGDGLDDVFVGGSTGQAPVLLIQNSDGTFRDEQNKTWNDAARYEDVDASFVDIDNDKDLDLYVVSGGNEWPSNSKNYQDRLYINDGNGNFHPSNKALPVLTESGSCVKPFDYDNDGDMDFFVGNRHQPWDYPTPVSSRILINSNGKFEDKTRTIGEDFIKLGMVTDAVWIDFDQDGLTDLVVTGEWMPISFFKNTGKKLENVTTDTGLSNTNGWWYSIEAGDMDNDGDMDLVAGNLGLNYKYKASEKEPFEVHYDDFDGNGNKDIVLSYYNFGRQYPLRGKSCSSQQIPQLSKKFPTYDLFASANLSEVYGESNLETSLQYKATSFESIYIENLGNGRFNSKPLPIEAQISNIDDILIHDFNNDGNNDLVIGGNMYPVEIETTRNDASYGLYLVGDGKGHFNPIPSKESGLYLTGDVSKLSYLQTAKSKLIISAVNNGNLGCFIINEN